MEILESQGSELRIEYVENFSSLETASVITFDHDLLYRSAVTAGLLIHVDLDDWTTYFKNYFTAEERSLPSQPRFSK